MFHFERLYALNEVVCRKTTHILLAWHREDKLDNEEMSKISREYMTAMGFGSQPYVVYRHRDTLSPMRILSQRTSGMTARE